eukprot:1664585-Rhodomonas_salina.2
MRKSREVADKGLGAVKMAKLSMSGSVVALITPFTDDDQVDYAKIEELVDWHIAEGYKPFYLFA